VPIVGMLAFLKWKRENNKRVKCETSWSGRADSNRGPLAPKFTEQRMHHIAATSGDGGLSLCSCGSEVTQSILAPDLPTPAPWGIIGRFRGGLRHKPRHTEWAADRDEGTLSFPLPHGYRRVLRQMRATGGYSAKVPIRAVAVVTAIHSERRRNADTGRDYRASWRDSRRGVILVFSTRPTSESPKNAQNHKGHSRT
jgi:hypothetical protein